ncbi:MAG: hypothetical protein M1817_000724 [Caeruleum heppii]|nr:MAG: hypothetical protein M1817_000724 [Caeruleum heppii]
MRTFIRIRVETVPFDDDDDDDQVPYPLCDDELIVTIAGQVAHFIRMASEPSRPPLKLRLSTGAPPPQQKPDTPAPQSATTKIKIKLGAKTPTTPVSTASPAKAEKKKHPKITLSTKLSPIINGTTAKKRVKAIDDDADDTVEIVKPVVKKLKLNHRGPVTPIIRVKAKGKPPFRPPGVGYDSESSDHEIDPHIEEEFILRMAPGDDCDYLRKAIEEKRLGLPKRENGADVSLKFLNREGRRAVVTIRQKHYAATMVDLPGVIEGMKSWDRKGWWKTADICQMLLVICPIATEEQALTVPLPPQIDQHTFQYPHGLTPPMHDVRRRRFRKRISNKTIEKVEDEVERLLERDLVVIKNGATSYEVLDPEDLNREDEEQETQDDHYNMLGTAGVQEGEYGEEDAEGEEVDENGYYYEDGVEGVDDLGEGLEATLEAAMEADDDDEDDDPTAPTTTTIDPKALAAAVKSATNPSNPTTTTKPTALPTQPGIQPPTTTSSTSSSSEDDDDDDPSALSDGDSAPDAETLEHAKDLAVQREEIVHLEEMIRHEMVKLEGMTNPLLKARQATKVRSLRNDLELRRGGLERGDDDGEEEEGEGGRGS